MRWRMPTPKIWVRIHAGLCVVWLLMTLPAVLLWKDSVPFLVFLSVYANFAGSVASWTAARADRDSPTNGQLDRLERKVDLLRTRLAAKR